LIQRRQLRFVHVDHHAPDDRSRYARSDSLKKHIPSDWF
jgi:hypothetical protein